MTRREQFRHLYVDYYFDGYTLKQTNESYPESYTVHHENGKQVAFMRMRDDFTLHCPDENGEEIACWSPNGEGEFEDWAERTYYMQAALERIKQWVEENPDFKKPIQPQGKVIAGNPNKQANIMLVYFCSKSQRHYVSCENFTTNILENASKAKIIADILHVSVDSMHMSKFDEGTVFWSDCCYQQPVKSARIIQNAIKHFER